MLEGFRREPDRIVVRDASRSLTGREFAGMVDRYAWALAARGLGAGDRVALLATESPEALAVRYAVALVGAASVFTPDTGRPERLVRFLKQIRPRLLVVFPETAPDAQAAAARVLSDETVSVGDVDGLDDLASEAAAAVDVPFVGRARPQDLAVLIASGGTTGTSKASMRSFDDYAALLGSGREPDRKLLTCSAFAYVSQVLIAQTLLGGGSVTLRDRFDPAELLRVVEGERITQLSLVEPLLAEFADHPALPEADLSSLRRVSHIGAAAPPSFRRRLLARLGPVLVNTYGASEIGMVSVLAAPDYSLDHPERLSTAGRPRPSVDVRIVAGDDAAAPVGTPGVIAVRLPGMASGYIGRPGGRRPDGRRDHGHAPRPRGRGVRAYRRRLRGGPARRGGDVRRAGPAVARLVGRCGRGARAPAASRRAGVRRGTGGGGRPPAPDRAGQARPDDRHRAAAALTGLDPVVRRRARHARDLTLLLGPAVRAERDIREPPPEPARAGVVVLERDGPRSVVPTDHVERQRAADPVRPDDRRHPQGRDGPALLGQPVHDGEADRCRFVGPGMGTPGQVCGDVGRGSLRKPAGLVPAVGVGEAADDEREVVTEALPQPPEGGPLALRDGPDVDLQHRVIMASAGGAGSGRSCCS